MFSALCSWNQMKKIHICRKSTTSESDGIDNVEEMYYDTPSSYKTRDSTV